MKKVLLSITLLLVTIYSYSQRKVQDMSDSYNRNGMSVLVITHGDSYDQQIKSAFERLNKGDKFDINLLNSTDLKVSYGRSENSTGWNQRGSEINSLVDKNDYGKQIISYIYNRKADGSMDAERVWKRGRYNADDRAYMEAQASVLGENILKDQGFALINQSYLMVIDYTNIEKKTDDKGKVTYSSKVEGYLYKIDYDDETNNILFTDAWIDEHTDVSLRQAKKEAFDNMQIKMSRKASISSSISSETVSGLVSNGYEKMFFEAEKREESLAVKMNISGVKPIRAKIGKKEGVKNKDRYYVYEYRQDATGNTIATRRGIVRATSVADNRYDASGNTDESEFFQISGYNLQEGQTLVQKNDLGMGVMAGYHLGGQSGLNVQIDWLAGINTKGISHYLLFDFNIDFYKPENYWKKDIHTTRPFDINTVPSSMTGFNVSLGYGLGVRFARLFEVVPNLLVGIDDLMLSDDDSDKDDDSTASKKMAYTGKVGAKLNVNLAASTQLVLGVDYAFFFSKGEIYEERYEFLNPTGFDKNYRKREGIGAFVGFKVTF